MKKVKYFLFILMILIPLNIKGYSSSIKNASIEGMDSVKVGNEFSQSFKVNFSDVNKGTTDTLGIWLVGFEIDYDEDIFIIESISTDGDVWSSSAYKKDNHTYVLSQFNKDPYHNACVDGVLYCADYIVSIKFYVKDTNKTSTKITMKDIEAGAFQVSGNLNPEYNIDDMIELEYSSNVSKTINITRPENVNIKEPKNAIQNSKPSVKKPVTTTKKKSNNNYLKSLTISGYAIDFSKNKTSYTIYIKDDVNSLKVKAVSEDKKATIKITGNDDLKSNDGKIIIKVKAENGDTKKYTITTKKETKSTSKIDDSILEKPDKKKEFKIPKKYITIAGCVIGVFLLLIIIKLIISHISNRKIDKTFDKF